MGSEMKTKIMQAAVTQLTEGEELKPRRCHCDDETFVVNDDCTKEANWILIGENESKMESDKETKIIQKAVTQLIEGGELKPRGRCHCDDDETFFGHDDYKKIGNASDPGKAEDEDKILKELRKIKKQNIITHCLLSVMIVVTVAWQLSEVSLILKVKEGFRNPLGSIATMIKGRFFKNPAAMLTAHEGDRIDSAMHNIQAFSLATLKIPELPHVEFPTSDFIHEELEE